MSGAEIALISLAAASTVMTAAGAVGSAQAQSRSSKYNAQMAERNAQLSRQTAAAEEEKQRRMTVLRQGAMRAGYGASGVSVEGTPLDMLEQSAAQEELDALTIRWRGDVGASMSQAEANLDRAKAGYASASGYVGAGSAILLGGTKIAGARDWSAKPKEVPVATI